jgi:nitroreductase
MDLVETLRTTGAIRDFRDEPVPDEQLFRILDTARFAPSGGNRQGWRVIVVRDAAIRASLRDIYLRAWYEYLAISAAGLVPWSPITDADAERRAVDSAADFAAAGKGRGGMAEQLDEVPVLLLVVCDLRSMACVDRDLARYTFAGGASVYPFVWSILLAARAEGVGGVITSVAIHREPEVKELFGLPDEYAVAALLAMGYPEHPITRLRRRPVGDFATVDRLDGPAFSG